MRLLPPPIQTDRMPARRISAIAAGSDSSDETSTSHRAGPPMAKRVQSRSGTFSEIFKPGIAASIPSGRKSIYPQSSMFPGFPPEALKFLRNLERNNNRGWFQPRKETFDTKLKARSEEHTSELQSL